MKVLHRFNILLCVMLFALCNADDSLTSRIKACAHKHDYNAKYDNCEIEYVPEFVMKNGDLAFQKNYQSCYSAHTLQTLKDKQGKSISRLLGAKVSETHKKFLYFIDTLGDNDIANLQNYTISIIFETEGQGFFKADWFFGDWSK